MTKVSSPCEQRRCLCLFVISLPRPLKLADSQAYIHGLLCKYRHLLHSRVRTSGVYALSFFSFSFFFHKVSVVAPTPEWRRRVAGYNTSQAQSANGFRRRAACISSARMSPSLFFFFSVELLSLAPVIRRGLNPESSTGSALASGECVSVYLRSCRVICFLSNLIYSA